MKEAFVYDIFILKGSGLPLLAGCTGSEYCMMHADNHELQAGFLTALFSFSKEAFNSEILNKILTKLTNSEQQVQLSTNKHLKYSAPLFAQQMFMLSGVRIRGLNQVETEEVG